MGTPKCRNSAEMQRHILGLHHSGLIPQDALEALPWWEVFTWKTYSAPKTCRYFLLQNPHHPLPRVIKNTL